MPMALVNSFTDKQKNLSGPSGTFPAEVKQGDTLPSVGSQTVNKYPFFSLFSATFFTFLSFFVGKCSV